MALFAKRVLIVDDEPENCFVVAKALEEEGFECQSAFSGEEALDLTASQKPDLVLLDIRMPGIDGMEVLSRLRAAGNGLPVVIVSAFEHVTTAVRCMRLGAYDYLTKPINIHELKITVANAFRTLGLQHEVERLKSEIERGKGLEKLVGESQGIRAVCSLVKRVAGHDVTVLITGESGTGKELVAEAIHDLSLRRGKPFVSVDCAALPEHLVESELFGFEKGAFTGAVERRMGRFEMAQGGVLFLDEVGNLPLSVQVKLLRVLQERQVSRLGSGVDLPVDLRIVAATNTDLKAAIRKGLFREDLFYRLNEINVHLPPLRERGEDLVLLSNFFLHRFNSRFGRNLQGFSPEAMRAIRAHGWSGNVRELQNVVKRAVILAEGQITPADLPPELGGGDQPSSPQAHAAIAEDGGSFKAMTQQALRQVDQEMITRALKASRWNKTKTAKLLKIDYKTLYNKLKEYHIE